MGRQQKNKPNLSAAIAVSRFEWFLFSLFIFLIPSNLSLQLYRPTAYVNGILVDYLIPKLFLSDLVFLLLFLLWLLRSRARARLASFFSTHSVILLSLLAILSASTLLAARPIPAFYFLLRLGQLLLTGIWLHSILPNLKPLQGPLATALIFQSLLAIIQWIQKKSLLGYLFLGETTIRTAPNIAKSTLGGSVRPLPYGTTPHPNVLGGFIAISLLILVLIRHFHPDTGSSIPKRLRQFLAFYLPVLSSLIALFLTQSVSAIIALLLGLLLFRVNLSSRQNRFSVLAILLAFGFIGTAASDPTSITRRLQLIQISFDMFISHPIFGVGLNNFTAVMPQFGEITNITTRFFQPVHNIYLLWLTETGLAGLIALFTFIWQQNRFFTLKSRFRPKVPLLSLLVIGVADHYPLTLQTGQLLLVLCLVIIFLPLPKPAQKKPKVKKTKPAKK